MRLITTLILTTLTALFIGCGSGSSSNNTNAITAQLVDSPIAGVTYICQDGTSGITDANGMFTCNSAPVTFRIGNLQLGVVDPIPADSMIFPEDLLGIDRGSYDSNILLALIRLLQSMDADGDISETITIPSEMADNMNACYSDIERFHLNTNATIDEKLNEYAACAKVNLVDGQSALDNLKDYYNSHVSSSSSSSSSVAGGGGTVSSQESSASSQNSSTSLSSASTSSSASQAADGTWSIDVTFNGRAYSDTWHWDNVKIASTTDTVKTEWDDSYPFPYMGSYGGIGKILVDTSFYNTNGDDGLILSYYAENYGVNGSAIFVKQGFCLDTTWIDDKITDHGDTTLSCSNDIYTGSTWDTITTSLNSEQEEALLAHKAFTFHDTGRWVNDAGDSSLTIIFTPMQ